MEEAILVIGDEETVRSALHEWLEIAFPHYCIIVTATEEAIDLVLSRLPRVIIIDVGPPLLERLEVAQHIKVAYPAAQIVIWTIYGGEKYRIDALAAGAAAYVIKESTPDEMLLVLRTILPENARPDSGYLQTNAEGGKAITGDR